MVIIKSIDTVLKQDEEQLNTEKGCPALSFGPWKPVSKEAHEKSLRTSFQGIVGG